MRCLNVVILVFGLYETFAQTVNVSVYYESLCPDSIKFIDNQLFPTYKYIGNYIKLELVPYGNAKTIDNNGKLKFVCQHGPKECYANKFHSCAISGFSAEESTEFVYCDLRSGYPSSYRNLEKCANSSGISWATLKMCLSSGQADKILENNGIKTHAVKPPITFVPTVTFNGVYNETLQDEATDNFMRVVCQFLEYSPLPCNKYVRNNIEVNMV